MKKKDRVEAVAMIGVYGFIVSLCGMYPFHYGIVKRTVALGYSLVYISVFQKHKASLLDILLDLY